MKKKCSCVRGLKTLILSLMMVCTMGVSAVNAEVLPETEVYIQNNYSSLPSSVRNQYFTTDPTTISASGAIQTIVLNDGKNTLLYYKDIDSSIIDGKVEAAIDASKAGEKLDQSIGNMGVAADLGTANDLLSGFVPLVSAVLGVAVIGITVFMTVFSAIDIVYIVFPITRAFFDNQDEKHKRQIVTDDARYAVKNCNFESGKSPMGTYFTKRVWSYIILAIMLFILLTGNISLITNLALKLVSGVLDVLTGI